MTTLLALPLTLALGAPAAVAAPEPAQPGLPSYKEFQAIQGRLAQSEDLRNLAEAVEAAQAAGTQLPGLGMPKSMPGPERTPFEVGIPAVANLPSRVSVEKIEWYTGHHVITHIRSATVPGKPTQVEILLPRDWCRGKERTLPSVCHLDGMASFGDYSGWIHATNIERFCEDKNVLVVMPAGGTSSFYSDWDQSDSSQNYKRESFITKELVLVTTNGFRSNDERGIISISMGATGAYNVAAHSPELQELAGSLSGYLDMTSPNMPQAIVLAMKNTGGYDATKVWGPLGSQRWKDNGPKLNIDKLKGISLYISAGNGNTGEWDVPSQIDPTKPDNPTGYVLEVLSRMTSETST